MQRGAPPKPPARGLLNNNEHEKSLQDKGYNNDAANPINYSILLPKIRYYRELWLCIGNCGCGVDGSKTRGETQISTLGSSFNERWTMVITSERKTAIATSLS
jgi:hypothetical protein